jgi:hypothetical protein
LAAALSCAAAEPLYYFVDERGVPHFSNVPHDARYRPLAGGLALSTGAPVQAADGPVLIVTVLPAVAKPAQRIEATVTLPGSPSMRGLVEVQFDPNLLAFEDSSVEAYLAAPGRVHVEIEPGIAAAFMAAVEFTVAPAARGQATLRAVVLDLEDEERRAVAVRPAAPAVFRVEP